MPHIPKELWKELDNYLEEIRQRERDKKYHLGIEPYLWMEDTNQYSFSVKTHEKPELPVDKSLENTHKTSIINK